MGISDSNDPMKAVQYLMLLVGSVLILFIFDLFSPHPPKIKPRIHFSKNLASPKKSKAPMHQKIVSVDTSQISVIPEKVGGKETSDSAFFETLLAEYENNSLDDRKKRNDITIRYYKKYQDQDRVYTLRRYGFYIHERPTDTTFDDFPTNAIYYGDSVNHRDIMLIAYILLKQGFAIQEISLSKYHDNWKEHSIEIGTDSTAIGKPAISLSEIRKISRD